MYKKEIQDGKIRFDGCVQASIIYLADNEKQETRGIYAVLDFTKFMDFEECKSEMNLYNKFNIKNIYATVINERKISVKAELELNVKVNTNESVDLITKINSDSIIQKLDHNTQVNLQCGSGNTKVFAKDTLSLDEIDQVAEVLKIDFRLTNKDKKISYNKVLAKTDAEIKILYLTEDNRINKVEAVIPVMGFIDIPNISEENICDITYELRNLIVKPNNEHSIYVEAELDLLCDVFEKRQIEIIDDLYSPTQNLRFTQKKLNVMSNKKTVVESYAIREKLPVQDIAGGKIYEINVEPYFKSIKPFSNRIMYEGEVKLKILYSNEIEGIAQKELYLPFNFSAELEDIGENSNIDTELVVVKQNFILLPDEYLDAQIDLQFNINSNTLQDVNVIDEVVVEDKNREDIYSMVIYFVKPNDTLWKIAKEFGSTVDDIVRVNGIQNEDVLQVGKQLYIPRFSAKTI